MNEEVIEEKKNRIDYSKYGVMFILPFFIVFLLFQAYPIVHTFILSISDLSGFKNSFDIIGFSNYVDLFNDPVFWESFKTTVIIWMMNFIPQMALAIFLASVFTSIRTKYKGEGFFKVVFYLPNIITAATMAIIFRTFFSYPTGPINIILSESVWMVNFMNWIKNIWGIGWIFRNWAEWTAPMNFFRGVWETRSIVAFIQFFMWYGHTMIIMMAGIKAISPTLFESAMIDGANSRQIFRKITLPLIRPIILYTLVTSLVGGMQMFDIPYLLTNKKGSPDGAIHTLAIYIYNQAFTGSRNFNTAAAASVVVLIFVSIITILLFRVFRENNTAERRVK